MHVHLFARFYLEAHHILLALLHQLVHLIGRHGERVAHCHAGRSVLLKVGDSLSLGLKFLGLVESNVSLAAVEQYIDILLVYLSPLTLPVGTLVAPKAHALIEFDAEPLKRFQNLFLCTWHKPMTVGVLYSEHQVTAMLLCKEIVIQCCAHTTNM